MLRRIPGCRSRVVVGREHGDVVRRCDERGSPQVVGVGQPGLPQREAAEVDAHGHCLPVVELCVTYGWLLERVGWLGVVSRRVRKSSLTWPFGVEDVSVIVVGEVWDDGGKGGYEGEENARSVEEGSSGHRVSVGKQRLFGLTL